MSIFDQVLAFIDRPDADSFDGLALEVFRYQARNVAPYRAHLARVGVEPSRVRALTDIPVVSTAAFKYAPMESGGERPSIASRVFLTSGTTIGKHQRGRHAVLRPEVYRASALGHLRRMLFPDGRRTAVLALHPTADRLPESSLSQMITWCIEEFGCPLQMCAATREGIDTEAAVTLLGEIVRTQMPVSILATTASCAALFAHLREASITMRLPEGSRLMDTGGLKGQSIPLSATDVVDQANLLLGIDPMCVINEYGMTEMCSQLYDATGFNSDIDFAAGPRMKIAPPWLSASAVDPVTLAPVDEGKPGLLAFFDLANVGSVSALLTEDFGIIRDGMVAILGRSGGGDPRGCALAIEQFAAARATEPAIPRALKTP